MIGPSSVGTLWSIVAIDRSGRRTLLPASRRPSNAWGEVTSWIRCRSTKSMAGSPSGSATRCRSQIRSNRVLPIALMLAERCNKYSPRAADGVSPRAVAAAVRLRGDRAAEAGATPRRGGRDRPRLRQPRPRLAAGCGREAGRGGREPAQPPLLGQSRHPEAAQRGLRPVPGSFRRRPRSRDTGGGDDRREGRAGAPDVGARRAGRQRRRAGSRVPDPHLRTDPGRRERDPGRARRQATTSSTTRSPTRSRARSRRRAS